MVEKILIFGNGQLGNFYNRHFTKLNVDNKIAIGVDITQPEQIISIVTDYQPTVIINTAAKTNLEWDNANKLETFNVNVLGANNIAEVCDQKGIYYIHFSSGCIMASIDENDAKNEDSVPCPISYYSWTKVWAENLIGFKKSSNFKYLILRPRQPVSAEINYKNMLLKLLTFTKFIDTPNSGTVIEDLMDWTSVVIDKRITGVLNVANKGWTTPYNIGLLLKKHVLPDLSVNKIEKSELNRLTPEKRVDTVLDISKLENIVGPVKNYETRLEEIIIDLANNFKSGDKQTIKEQLEKTVESSKTRTVVNDVWQHLLRH
jgi:dTDP-4-dehydrorhamnose reductase